MLAVLIILVVSYLAAEGLTIYKDRKIDELKSENEAYKREIKKLKITIGMIRSK